MIFRFLSFSNASTKFSHMKNACLRVFMQACGGFGQILHVSHHNHIVLNDPETQREHVNAAVRCTVVFLLCCGVLQYRVIVMN